MLKNEIFGQPGGGYNQVNFASAGNKSYARTDSYVLEDNTGNNIFHLSFDDTIQVFEDINKNKYESIFENSTFGWYRDLHESYGVVISCYVYYEDGDFNLSKFPSRYKDEFIQNSS